MMAPPTIESFPKNGTEYDRVTYGDVILILQRGVLRTRFKDAIDLMMEYSPPPPGVYPIIFLLGGEEHTGGRRVQRGSPMHTRWIQECPEFDVFENIIFFPTDNQPATEEWAGRLVHEIRHFGHQTPQGPPTEETTKFMIDCEAEAYSAEREFYRRLKIPSKRHKALMDQSRKNQAAARFAYLEYIRKETEG